MVPALNLAYVFSPKQIFTHYIRARPLTFPALSNTQLSCPWCCRCYCHKPGNKSTAVTDERNHVHDIVTKKGEDAPLKQAFRKSMAKVPHPVTDERNHVHDIVTKKGEDAPLKQAFRKSMAKVPHPVVVVSTGEYDSRAAAWLKRGLTCSSFTSVSLDPPIVSFCVNNPSRFHNILVKSKHFAVNVLAKDQVGHGVHFSKPAVDGVSQFKSVSYEEGIGGVPVIRGCCAVLQCEAHSAHAVGDHYVWYGHVIKAEMGGDAQQPLLYFTRSVGDEIFLQAFKDATLPFEDWTHEAHLRMAWNFIREFGREQALPLIREGILKYNEQNKEKITHGYHETVTVFYVHLVAHCIQHSSDPKMMFEEFIAANPHLTERSLILNYYSPDTIARQESKERFVEPDKKALP